MQDPRTVEFEYLRMIYNEHPTTSEVRMLSDSQLLAEYYNVLRKREVIRLEITSRFVASEQERIRLARIAWEHDKKLPRIKTKRARRSREEKLVEEIRAFKRMFEEYLAANPEVLEELRDAEPDAD